MQCLYAVHSLRFQCGTAVVLEALASLLKKLGSQAEPIGSCKCACKAWEFLIQSKTFLVLQQEGLPVEALYDLGRIGQSPALWVAANWLQLW